MTILLFVLGFFLFTPVYAQNFTSTKKEVKPLYQLPERVSPLTEKDSTTSQFLVGSDSGLFKITVNNSAVPLWTEGRVDQIVQINVPNSKKIMEHGWIMRTSRGIIFTSDLEHFEERNEGLSFLTIKKYVDKQTSLEKQIQELKDICVNPVNNSQMVTATKDNVFYSTDAGHTWKNIGSMSRSTPGVKAVAIATLDGETVIFMSHPIFGLSYTFPDRKNSNWNDVSAGFEIMPSLSSPDEISDILPVVRTPAQTALYLQKSIFLRHIFRAFTALTGKQDVEN